MCLSAVKLPSQTVAAMITIWQYVKMIITASQTLSPTLDIIHLYSQLVTG